MPRYSFQGHESMVGPSVQPDIITVDEGPRLIRVAKSADSDSQPFTDERPSWAIRTEARDVRFHVLFLPCFCGVAAFN